MLNGVSFVTSEVGDIAQIMSATEVLASNITISPVYNLHLKIYEEVVRLSGCTIYDEDVAKALSQIKEIEERHAKRPSDRDD